MCHDIGKEIYQRASMRTRGFINKSSGTMAEWELYLLGELIDSSLIDNDIFENDNLKVICYRNKFGLAIIENKRLI